jgi:hypothetical protein
MRFLFAAILSLCAAVVSAATFDQMVGNVQVAPVQQGTTQVPFIVWGGDVPTLVANGGLNTSPASIYGKKGLKLKMVPGDDFTQQVRDFISGKSPYLRGTLRMMGVASELLNRDPRTKPIFVLQLTWSAGDHIVARESVHTLNDLKGKKIALQQVGPHLGLLEDSLQAAGLSWDDIKVVWCKDLTGSEDSPAEKFRKDSSIDACCVISPDMIGLCSGLDKKGSGAEGTVKGSHVVNSTASMSHSIADVYAVRNDYWQSNRGDIEKFVVGYLRATEDLVAAAKVYNNGKGKSPQYMEALKLAQTIWGVKTLPTLENDAHGLICDANFVRIPGNESFFNDSNNLNGFEVKQKSALDLAVRLGYTKEKFGFGKADWDYKKMSSDVGVAYVSPVFATGRIKAEVTDFSKDLEDDTILSFTIQFEPEQTTFPIETYAADFQRVVKNASTFGNAVVLIRGHSDPALALQHFFWAAKAKGLITGDVGNYRFKDQPLNLTDTTKILMAVNQENLAGQKRQDKAGNFVPIPDPKLTVQAAVTLSLSRAEVVKKAVEQYAKDHSLPLDLSQIRPQGVGIAEPIVARPTSLPESKKNMRVEFRVVRVAAEAVSETDYNFDK